MLTVMRSGAKSHALGPRDVCCRRTGCYFKVKFHFLSSPIAFKPAVINESHLMSSGVSLTTYKIIYTN